MSAVVQGAILILHGGKSRGKTDTIIGKNMTPNIRALRRGEEIRVAVTTEEGDIAR